MSTADVKLDIARAKIADLVELFRANERGYAPAYKDVIHEDAIKVGGMTKAPDYCFHIGGQRKFFVEAKKPLVDMKL